MESLSSLIRSVIIVAGTIGMLSMLTQCGSPNDPQSADNMAQVSDVKEKGVEDPQEEALRFGHAIDSDFDKRIAEQCYDTMRIQHPDMPNQTQDQKAYTISQMQETGVWTAHIVFRSNQGWKGVFCDFNASGEMQLKDAYNY